MTFKEIYDRIIPLWGSKIDFSDGVISNPENALETPTTSPLSNNSFYSKTLSLLWDTVEETVGYEDTFGDAMVWAMYQVFHTNARYLFQNGIFSLDPMTVGKQEIEEQYFSNLHDESWEEELSQYERIIE